MPASHPIKNMLQRTFSADFIKITQNFFGAYIRGEGVLDAASIQNGTYIQIVDEVKAVDSKELDMIKKRCQVMYELGNDAFDSYQFCYGMGYQEAEDTQFGSDEENIHNVESEREHEQREL